MADFDTSRTDHSIAVYSISEVNFAFSPVTLPPWFQSQNWYEIWKIDKFNNVVFAGETILMVLELDSANTKHCFHTTSNQLDPTAHPFAVSDGDGGSNLHTWSKTTLVDFTFASASSSLETNPAHTSTPDTAKSSTLNFDLHLLATYMTNPCQIKVRQFDQVQFSPKTPVSTVMNVFMPVDVSDTALYTCPDSTYPDNAATPYKISISNI